MEKEVRLTQALEEIKHIAASLKDFNAAYEKIYTIATKALEDNK